MNVDKYPKFSILIVDDEPSWLRSLGMTLEGPGGFTNLLQTSVSSDVMGLLEQYDVGVLLLDLNKPHIGGEELLERVNREYPEISVIILSGINQLEMAVGCMRKGAFDYFVKTVEEDRLIGGVHRAVRMVELQRENRQLSRHMLKCELEHPEIFDKIVTRNPKMQAVFSYLESIAGSRHPILILGESGVGKELIAHGIHQLENNEGSLVSINVAGLDDNAFADTLFGHQKGAFTGAERARSGLIEQAAGGTLFLDEIGDLSLASQVKLLRLLQEGEYYRLGSDTPSQLRARIICATHKNLNEAVTQGTFRKDLYYRLNTHMVRLPPLRERREDLPLLLEYFLETSAEELDKPVPTPPRELAALLNSYSFPGNLRELKMMVHDAVSRHSGGVLSMSPFIERIGEAREQLVPVADNPFIAMCELPTISAATELLVDAALGRAVDNQSLAARLLGISQPALSKRLKQRRQTDDKGV